MITKDVLIGARALISDPEHWCQGAYATDNTGCECIVHEDFAHSFCSIGAICKVSVRDTIDIERDGTYQTLHRAILSLGGNGVADWNDGEEFEIAHKRVLTAFDLAIERA